MKRVLVHLPVWSVETTLDEEIYSWDSPVAIRRILHYRITIDGHSFELYRDLPPGWFQAYTIKSWCLRRLHEK